ncbi:MAG: lactate utilization protein [Ruminococcaceae bacterium]|nr:lactate utilization protein [Oscillospiraceae bacterium]
MDFTLIKQNLEKMGYSVSCFETREDAKQYLLSRISGKTVGIGGTVTVKELDILPELSQSNKVIWHWFPENGNTPAEALSEARDAEIYISSVNGIAETGEIVNIDGTCNRISATLYGHKKVYFIIGENKIEPTLEKAVWRARNIASPLNARRLGKKTPCASGELKCHDCNSPERICRSLNIMLKKPGGCDYEIVLVNQKLGY